MTHDEMSATVGELKSDVRTLTDELRGLVELEKERHEADAVQKRRHEDSDRRRMEIDLLEYQNKQKFLSKHGGKIASVIFSAVVAGLTWYGAKIRSEVKAEQRAKDVDTAIETNTNNFNDFKKETEEDIESLQKDSINHTLMMDEGFNRLETGMLKANKRLKPEDFPQRPVFNDAVTKAKCVKAAREKGFKEAAIEAQCNRLDP